MNIAMLLDRQFRSILIRFAIGTAGMLTLGVTHAASVCVTNGTQLTNAITQSRSQADDQPFTIKMVKGTYSFGYYSFVPTSQFSMLGGYTDNTCTARDVDPANTVIDFNGTGYMDIQQLDASPIANITIDGITFSHGEHVAMLAGHYNQFFADQKGSIQVRNSRFTNLTSNPNGKQSYQFTPVDLGNFKGTLTVVNTVFDHLNQIVPNADCEVLIDMLDDAYANFDFITVDTSAGKSFCINPEYDGDLNQVAFYNSIIWPNDGVYGNYHPLEIRDQGDQATPPNVFLYGNTIFDYGGPGNFTDSGTLSANPIDKPLWTDPAAGDYHLLPTSTSINSGLPLGPNGPLDVPPTDIESSTRWVGNLPDRGAYESPLIDNPPTIVMSTADAGPGTLRAALAISNQGSDVNTITFNLPCPSVIKLKSPLIVHQPVIIDGYANNASAKPNDSPNAFNASICVIVTEETYGTVVNAIDADLGALTLRGLAFSGFYTQLSLSGSDSTVTGNQFGGTVAGIPLNGAQISAIRVSSLSSGSVNIGGVSPGERNVIDGANSSGIYLDSTVTTTQCHVNNNLMGMDANGTTTRGNGYAMEIRNNGCDVSKNYIAGNFLGGIWIHDGQKTRVQSNTFGLNALGNATDSYGYAIVVDGDNNIIGAPSTSGFLPTLGNAISFMDLGGVQVNGSGNSVRANLSSFNGYGNNGTAPDIALSAAENLLAPYPVIDSLQLPQKLPAGQAQQATITGRLSSGSNEYLRVDAYYSATCSPAGRGHAEYYLATLQVKTDANGKAKVNFTTNLPASAPTSVLSLTATDSLGNTSELGECFANDGIFKNGLDK